MPENFLFIREAQLEMFPKIPDTNKAINETDKRIFKGRIQFNVDLNRGSEPNKATIKLYNINQETRSFLENDNILVDLFVGYDGNISRIFRGDIIENGIKVERSDADVIVSIECGDAEKIIHRRTIEITLGPGAKNTQVFNQAITKLNLKRGNIVDIPEKTFFKGFQFSGTVKSLLDQMTKQVGLEWSVQNGILNILDRNKLVTQDAVLVTKDTGLIGFPSKTKKRIEFRALINNKIIPGSAVKLISQQTEGIVNPASQSKINAGVVLKVEKATFDGDTDEGAWEVKVEGSIPTEVSNG